MAKPNLISRLFFSVFIALVIGITLTTFLIEHLDQKEEQQYFSRDVGHLLNELDLVKLVGDPTKDHIISLPAPYSYHFSAFWRSKYTNEPFCPPCTKKKSALDTDYYMLNVDHWLAAHSPPGMQGKLIITNEEQATHPQNNDEFEASDRYYSLWMTMITMLSVALFMLKPISALQLQIRRLIKVNQAFGQGKLDVRADDQYSSPLDQLSGSFNKMADAITQSVNESQIFAQAIPHEIRTPLSRIQLSSGLLQQICTDPEQKNLLEDIEHNIQDIDQLVNQVMTYSRLQLQQQECPTPLRQIHVLSFLNARLKLVTGDDVPQLIVDIDTNLYFQGDVILLRLILDNLIKNALRYATDKVWITASFTNTWLNVVIKDNGQGIPKDFQQKVFMPFSRLDSSRNRNTGGLGLGLAIVKLAIQKSDGTIRVTNGESGGAKFILQLPCQSLASQAHTEDKG